MIDVTGSTKKIQGKHRVKLDSKKVMKVFNEKITPYSSTLINEDYSKKIDLLSDQITSKFGGT